MCGIPNELQNGGREQVLQIFKFLSLSSLCLPLCFSLFNLFFYLSPYLPPRLSHFRLFIVFSLSSICLCFSLFNLLFYLSPYLPPRLSHFRLFISFSLSSLFHPFYSPTLTFTSLSSPLSLYPVCLPHSLFNLCLNEN